ncbi:MAG: tyrosine-type recombinase/integrase [Acidimicrobiales bacterium]
MIDAATEFKQFGSWVAKQPLSDRTRRAYGDQVRNYLNWLEDRGSGAEALADPAARDSAVRDYKRWLKRKRKLAPASVNQALASIDALYRSRHVAAPLVQREQLPELAPRALNPEEQRRLMRAIERSGVSRDRAIATMLLHAGLRLSELAALEVDDVQVSPRKGSVLVRSGKGDRQRSVPLNSICREAISLWLIDRHYVLDRHQSESDGLWLSRLGSAMSVRSIGNAVDKLAKSADIEMSPHVLRHTFVTNLVRDGVDVVLVAELAGHRNLDTTRRYSLPTVEDLDAAVESLANPSI